MEPTVDILLVDDEPRNLDALEAILADPSYRLLRAQDADTALRLLLNHEVAVIVLDIKMPGVSGFELAQMIKNTKRFRETPIVFLTAYMVEDQDIVSGYGAGGVDYLTKPMNPKILRHKVAVFADLHRKSRELAKVNEELARLNERLEERVEERTRELQRSEEALRAAAHQKDVFLAVLAHELRNPLTPIRAGLDLLVRHRVDRDSAPLARTLSSMNRQLDHMVRLIDDLLDASRMTRGSVELRRERVDLAKLVQSTLDGARPWFERRQQKLTTEIDDGIFAYADPTRVSQILTNLLHNATKFAPEGGTIRVELSRGAETAVLRVIDSGVGIVDEQIERVFDMFTRIRRPGAASEPGLGIGLALARRLAEMHGGTLSAFSEGEGRGATFSLRLPTTALVDGSSAPIANVSSPSVKAARPLNIVVVEDVDDAADVLFEWLEDLGHRVTVARTGEAGVEAIRDRRPNVVICDIGLPDISGLEVSRRVRSLAGETQPIMIALTGWGRSEDRRASSEAGFDLHLVKPVAADALRGVLQSASESLLRRAEDSPAGSLPMSR